MANKKLDEIKGCVFDAYGTLFDFNSAVSHCRDVLGGQTDALSRIWREKQLQYTWLRSLMGRHKDFWQVTGDALDFAMKSLVQLCISNRQYPLRLLDRHSGMLLAGIQPHGDSRVSQVWIPAKSMPE
jgi:2-haloacid dehalogenase